MWLLKFFIFLIMVAILTIPSESQILVTKNSETFPLSIIHLNDFHARFEEIDTETTNACKEGRKCVGGFARVVTMVRHLKETLPNPVYLNAGDNFSGTLWYNLLYGNFTAMILNAQPPDVITIGNHEFDHKIDGVIPFLEIITAPVVVSNMDIKNEPRLEGLFKKSTIIERDGRKIGVIGVILSTTNTIAQTEKLIFTDEAEAVRAEAENLNNQGVNIIIVLSHSGLDVDLQMAKLVGPYVDVIVGGHTHSFMWTGENPPSSHEIKGNYPEVVTQSETKHRVLIVQALCFTQYLGNLTVWFDDAGEIIDYEGAPIYLDDSVVQDSGIVELLAPYKELVDAEALIPVGMSFVDLSEADCYSGDCNIGNMITDAFVDYYVNLADNNEWSKGTIALINNGGIRSELGKGDVNYGDLKGVLPFDNSVDIFDLKGIYLWNSLESSCTEPFRFLQMSGLHVVADMTKPVGKRLVSVDVLCRECEIPEYRPLQSNETYRIITLSFLATGGSGYDDFKYFKENYEIGPLDIDVVEPYFRRVSPLITPVDGRFKVLNLN